MIKILFLFTNNYYFFVHIYSYLLFDNLPSTLGMPTAFRGYFFAFHFLSVQQSTLDFNLGILRFELIRLANLRVFKYYSDDFFSLRLLIFFVVICLYISHFLEQQEQDFLNYTCKTYFLDTFSRREKIDSDRLNKMIQNDSKIPPSNFHPSKTF